MQVTFGDIQVNEGFIWAGLTFLKTSEQHGECLDDPAKSQLFHNIAGVQREEGQRQVEGKKGQGKKETV